MLLSYFANLTIYTHSELSLFGFLIFVILMNQLISGTMLAFSLLPDPMLMPMCREEEDLENLYTDDFFWLHERGVDYFFLLLMCHLMSKLYMRAFLFEQELAWKSGVVLFFLSHGVMFFGLILCCTHLSEITLTIAANMFHTMFFFKGKMYWWLFTDMLLNVDTLLRLAYMHYTLAFILVYYGITHAMEMHYDWRGMLGLFSNEFEFVWFLEGLLFELGFFIKFIIFLKILCIYFYKEPEALSYEIFMWGDVGLITDVSFYGVAPHWYFSPYMSWLMLCPYHILGLCGLGFLFVMLYFQPNLASYTNTYLQDYMWYSVIFFFFTSVLTYTTSFLPYGSFFNQMGGNSIMLFSYLFMYSYLGTTVFSSTFLFILKNIISM